MTFLLTFTLLFKVSIIHFIFQNKFYRGGVVLNQCLSYRSYFVNFHLDLLLNIILHVYQYIDLSW